MTPPRERERRCRGSERAREDSRESETQRREAGRPLFSRARQKKKGGPTPNSLRPITPSLCRLNGPLGCWPIVSSHHLPRLLLSPDPRLPSSLVQPSTPPSASSHPPAPPPAGAGSSLHQPRLPPPKPRSGGVELSGAEIRPLVCFRVSNPSSLAWMDALVLGGCPSHSPTSGI